MTPKAHVSLLLQFVSFWLVFWLVGWPDYYQQWPAPLIGAASVLLSTLISLFALWVIAAAAPERRATLAFWYAFYFTAPLAALDTLYCGVHLGLGPAYVVKFWYLSVFYLTPWLTFTPTVWLLARAGRGA